MIKKCVVENGIIRHVGDWDFQYLQVEISPPEHDEDGNVIKDAVYEQVAQKPLPEGAIIEERDFEFSLDYGWLEVGTPTPLTFEEQLAEKNRQIESLKEQQATMQGAIDFIIMNY